MGANTVVVAVQAVVLVPVYLKVLGARQYGAWLGSGEILNFLQLFDLGLSNIVTERIGAAHARGDREGIAVYFGSALFALTVVGAALALIALAVSFWVAGWMGLSGDEAGVLRSCFRLGALATFLFVANFAALGLARGTQDVGIQNVGTVVGAIAGMIVTLVMVLRGYGLWSIPVGMCARTAVVLIVSMIHIGRLLRHGVMSRPRVSRAALVEFARLSPSTTLSGLALLLANQTEASLVGALLGPEKVPVLTLTRRAIDVAGSLLNTLSYSSYAGFAHLVNSGDRARAREVSAEVQALFVALALAAAAGFIAANHSLVTVWTKTPAVYGGALLTMLVAGQVLFVGRAQLLYYLYRATGAIVPGSMLLFWESMARVVLMITLLKTVGLPGLAIAGIATTVVGGWIARRRLAAILPAADEAALRTSVAVFAARAAVVVVAGVACVTLYRPTWPFSLAIGALFSAASAALFLALDPRLHRARSSLTRMLRGSMSVAAGSRP
jgi:O-antigen/teichoic acid export membrane protein